jgi:calcineurin-like phosphoesterase family protein
LGGHALYLVHNPEEAPNSWDGWIIHGHHHANYPDRYPFVNRECKRINVSTEVVDYTPVSENRILEVINQ